jgi:hypothetical protein
VGDAASNWRLDSIGSKHAMHSRLLRYANAGAVWGERG